MYEDDKISNISDDENEEYFDDEYIDDELSVDEYIQQTLEEIIKQLERYNLFEQQNVIIAKFAKHEELSRNELLQLQNLDDKKNKIFSKIFEINRYFGLKTQSDCDIEELKDCINEIYKAKEYERKERNSYNTMKEIEKDYTFISKEKIKALRNNHKESQQSLYTDEGKKIAGPLLSNGAFYSRDR